MELVLTADDVASQLDLDPDQVEALIERGFLSGFYLGDEWRMVPSMLTGDLERMLAQLQPTTGPDLAPFHAGDAPPTPALRPKVDREGAGPAPLEGQGFHVRIALDNTTGFEGEFILYLGTENQDEAWSASREDGGRFFDGELLIRKAVEPEGALTLYESTFQGVIGDRLFLTIPEQPAVHTEVDRVFVLDDDLHLTLILTKRGVIGGKRVVKIKQG